MKPFRERNPFMVGGVSLVVIFIFVAFAFSLDRLTFLRGVYIIEADFADAAGLVPENEVRVAGLRVGKVRDVELAGPGGGEVRDRVRVTMEIDRGVDLGRASTSEIKLKTLLGAKFVQIAPRGGEPFLADGDRIPLERTTIPFELYQVQEQAVETLGVIDADELNEALRRLADITHDPEGNFGRAIAGLAEATDALAERDADLESLIQNADIVVAALAARSEELGRVLENGSRVLGALSERREALRRFVRSSDRVAGELTDFLRSTRGSIDPALRDLHTILQVVQPNIGNLEETVRTLGPTGEAFARPTTRGEWVEVWTASLLGLPLPPGVGLDDILGALPTAQGEVAP